MTLTNNPCGPLSDVLRGSFQKADQGDLSDLLKLGLSIRVIRKIQCLSSWKCNRACNLISTHLGNLLHQQLDSEQQQQRLEAIVAQVDKDHVDEVKQDKLILQKAPRDMMYRLYAMSYQEFATLRTALHVSDMGRPRQASPRQVQFIWDSWNRHVGLPYPDRFLQVAQDTRLDLRTVWPVLRPTLGLQETRRSLRSKRPSHLGAAAQPLSSTAQRA